MQLTGGAFRLRRSSPFECLALAPLYAPISRYMDLTGYEASRASAER